MKKTQDSLPSEQIIIALSHFSWCALVALRLAQQDGKARSPLTVHSFLVNWLACAQKQRRFPRSVTTDIDNLLRLGRQKGPAAGMHQRLEYLYSACTSPVAQQSDLFRLTDAIESLKVQGWINAVVGDMEWVPEALLVEYVGEAALLVKKTALSQSFSEEGKLIAPVEFLVIGDTSACISVFQTQGLTIGSPGPGRIILRPGR